MLATCLTFCVMALHSGSVVTLAAPTPLVAAGEINWLLQDRPIVVPEGTRAIVVRLAPDHYANVVEVRVLDGTNRLGWIVANGLTALTPPPSQPALTADIGGPAPQTTPTATRPASDATKTPRGKGRRAGSAGFDALLSSMFHDAYGGQDSGSSCSSCATMPAALITPF